MNKDNNDLVIGITRMPAGANALKPVTIKKQHIFNPPKADAIIVEMNNLSSFQNPEGVKFYPFRVQSR